MLPPALALRKEVENLPQTLARETSEAAVRRAVTDLNRRIMAVQRDHAGGPRIPLKIVDVDDAVRRWHERRADGSAA
jgi:hypothetical protein